MSEGWTGILGNAHPLFYLGILILCGYAGGRAAHALNLPRITGYILAGMLLSPSTTGILGAGAFEKDLSIITDIALGIIAFSIGGTLEFDKLRKLGKAIIIITFVQALVVALLVSASVIFLFPYLPGAGIEPGSALVAVGILLGAICAATAPAAVLGVVHEYKAKGPMTTVLLGVITLDDGITLVLFSMVAGIAGSLGGKGVSLVQAGLVEPGKEIMVALLIGTVAGLLLKLLVPVIRRRKALLGLTLGTIFLTSGIALTLHTSSLLACMMLGFFLVNTMNQPEPWFEVTEKIEEPLFAMFFVLAGAHLKIGALAAAGTLTAVIITMRTVGKLGGAYLGSVLSAAPAAVRRYLPLGLLPQAGVSIGLVLAAKDYVGDVSAAMIMVNAILASVIINELISPLLVKKALIKSSEAQNAGGE
ncbi:MAG: cation:proton antiporter [bacterium]|nr:cation:proton antiporter [bacterium]MDT8365442.1 cation:proton antiporter [bacterium]